MEAIYDYVEKNKTSQTIVNLDTYVENPDFIAVPDMYCSIGEKRKYLYDSKDEELKRFGTALEEWLTVYNQEFGKR